MEVFIEELILEGVHGVTAKEQNRRQPFRIDISVRVRDRSGEDGDVIESTLDYRKVKETAMRVVVEESHALLETIAIRIADEVVRDASALSVKVTVRKLSIWDSGIPGVTVCRCK